LTPRKANTLYPKVASELRISEELVSDVVSFYWKEVKKTLENPDHIVLRIKDFGTFEIRKQQVEYQIEKYKRLVKYIKPTTYTKHILLDIAVKKLEMMEKLLVLCLAQEEKKKQIREIQKNGKSV
jgi:nucleoid DNA-binding protein